MNRAELSSASGKSPDTIVRGAHLSKITKGGAARFPVVQRWASPLPSDLPRGCSPEQWAQSPNACAGPQGLDKPDPYMPDPNKKCDHPRDQPKDQPKDEPPPPDEPAEPIPPPLSDGPCLTWTLADGWLHGFAIGAAIFGQEEIPIVIAIGSLGAHKIVCGTWFDLDAAHP